MHASDIATGAPTWAYVLLAALVVLGVRRLTTRTVPIAVALIPSIAFLVWSVFGAMAFAGSAGVVPAALAWLVGAGVGAVSGVLLPEPRGQRLSGARVCQPGSPLPLILYLGVFVVRFACGAWAAIQPPQALLAITIGIAVGAAMTARLLVGIARWRPASNIATNSAA